MSLIKATRPPRRNYTITLASTDPNSYISAMGSPWMADYFVDMNRIMSQEEQARPYFIHFTFQSQAGASVGTPSTTPPVQLFLDFQNNAFPHYFNNSQYTPVGMLKFIPDTNTTAPQLFYLNATTIDNEELYINSMRGVNMISLRAIDISGAMYMPTVPFVIYIHLVPADF